MLPDVDAAAVPVAGVVVWPTGTRTVPADVLRSTGVMDPGVVVTGVVVPALAPVAAVVPVVVVCPAAVLDSPAADVVARTLLPDPVGVVCCVENVPAPVLAAGTNLVPVTLTPSPVMLDPRGAVTPVTEPT